MQRSARGAKGNASQKLLYPDFRTETGPIDSVCVTVPPHADKQFCGGPNPAPTPAVGRGSSASAACATPATALSVTANWTFYAGALVAGHDVEGDGNFTLSAAQAHCLSNSSCLGFTFEALAPSPTSCISSPCKVYFKSAIDLNSDSAWGTWLVRPMAHPPNPHRTDPACYSAHMFGNEAVRIIDQHAREQQEHQEQQQQQLGSGGSPPLYMYLAMQDVHEPVSAPLAYTALHAEIQDSTRRTYAGMISAMDAAIGNVTGALKSNKMWGQTIFVISNDNGGWLGYGGINYPYRGHKTTMYDTNGTHLRAHSFCTHDFRSQV